MYSRAERRTYVRKVRETVILEYDNTCLQSVQVQVNFFSENLSRAVPDIPTRNTPNGTIKNQTTRARYA
jgi:hypothetical protein